MGIFLNRLALTPLEVFLLVVNALVTLAVVALFAAIFRNFAIAREQRRIQNERKSVVATATMTLFFVGFYLLLHFPPGKLELPSISLRVGLALFGLGLVIGGCLVNIRGRLNLGKNWANQIIIYEDQTFVRTGMYRFVRHPLYASLIWMFIGASLIRVHWLALAATFLIFVPFMAYRARQEERLLGLRFPEYELYRQTTGMFFPRLIRKKRGDWA